ncbi:hypothetical protein L7F22_049792 [Adiantum nelumboides]|nr:hypothetical protein [Adiantum nelumboides]
MASSLGRSWKREGKATTISCWCSSSLLVIVVLGFLVQWNQLLFRTAPAQSKYLSSSSDFGILGVPWCRSKNGSKAPWTRRDLIQGLQEFVPIYNMRPIKNNRFGMGFDHSFGLWFMARWIQPELLIESGAFKGHSTWVLRQAMPTKPIISITPRHPEKYLQKGPAYVDTNCKYLAGKSFIDFGNVKWEVLIEEYGIKDYSKVLVFFDDHQNELRRFLQARRAGFQHLVFEDNYDTGTGDHYSLRQICDQPLVKGGGHSCFKDSKESLLRAARKKNWEKSVNTDELCGPGGAWWGVRGQMRENFNHSFVHITQEQHLENFKQIESSLELYWELPPVAAPSLTRQSRYDPARTTDPIIGDNESKLFVQSGLSSLDKALFNGYTQMVYLKVSQ